MRKHGPSRSTSAGTSATLPAAGRASRSRSVNRRMARSPSSSSPARAPVMSITVPGSSARNSTHRSYGQRTSARRGVIGTTSASTSIASTSPRTSILPRCERSRTAVVCSSARARGDAKRGRKRPSARAWSGDRKRSSLTTGAALPRDRRTGHARLEHVRLGVGVLADKDVHLLESEDPLRLETERTDAEVRAVLQERVPDELAVGAREVQLVAEFADEPDAQDETGHAGDERL